MIEAQQALVGKRVQKLNHEKRIATRFDVHELRQRSGALRVAVNGVRNQLAEAFGSERIKPDRLDSAPGVYDRLELARQRMRGVDLVVSIGADQHQGPQIRSGQDVLEQVERR